MTRASSTLSRRLPVVLAASCLLALSACGDKASQENANRQVDAAVAKTENAVGVAADKATQLADIARDKTRAYVTSPEVRQDAAAVKDAITNAGSAASASGDDAAITMSVSSALAKDAELSASKVDIQTRAGVVRLDGAASSAAAKARAGEIARSVKGVASVDNQLEVRS